MKSTFFVIEGLDAVGKTTLANNISKKGIKSFKTPSDIYSKIRTEIHNLKEASLFYYLSSLCYTLEIEAKNESNFILDRYLFSTITHYVSANKNYSFDSFCDIFKKFDELIQLPAITFFINLDFEKRIERISCRSNAEKALDNIDKKYNDFWIYCMNRYNFSEKIILDGNLTEKELTDIVISMIKGYKL